MNELFRLIGMIAVENAEANESIDETTDKAEKSESKLASAASKIGNGIAKAAKIGAAAIATMATIAGTALVGLTTQAVNYYAEYEQLVGGVETLFGAGGQTIEEYADSVGKTVDEVRTEYDALINAQTEVFDNAARAYETAGMSANEYMETVTGFSAALISSLGGDTEKAAEYADRAIVDMADNANKMGTSMELIQNAYQGFAKQNYTMLDNLKLGYGGTQSEMQRLIADAAKMTEVQEQLGITVDASSMSYDNIVNAIHVMQTEMGIAGATQAEAASTIQGSIGMLKASWTNFVTGLADENADLSTLMDAVIDSFTTVVDNIAPKVIEALPKIVGAVEYIIGGIAGYLPDMISELLPSLMSAVTTLVSQMITLIPSLLSSLAPVLVDTLGSIFEQISSSTGLDFSGLFDSIVEGASQMGGMLKSVLPSIVSVIQQLIPPLLQIAQEIIPIVVSLITELTPILMQIVESIVPLVSQLLSELIPPLLQIVQAILPVITSLLEPVIMIVQSLVTALSPIISILGSVVSQVANMLMPVIQQLCDFITTVLTPIIQGILFVVEEVIGWVVTFLTENMTIIQAIFQSAIDVISGIIDFFIALFTGNWSGMWEAVKSILNSAWEFITNVFNLIVAFITSIGSTIWSVVTNAWENVYTAIYGKITKIKDSISTVFNNIKETVSSIFGAMKDAVASVFEGMWSAIKGTINKILGGIETMANGVVSGINKLLDGIEAVANAAGELLGFDPISISLSTVSLPRLAKGGVLEKGQVGLLEGSGAEAVVPLEQNREWIQRVTQEFQSQGVGADNGKVVELLNRIIDLLLLLIESNDELPDYLVEAIANLKFSLNNREFARLVKAVQ